MRSIAARRRVDFQTPVRYTLPMSSNDYIVITGGRNLNEEGEDKNIRKEEERSSRKALEDQGIFLDERGEQVLSNEPQDQFSKKLKDIGGIEILSSEEGENENE